MKFEEKYPNEKETDLDIEYKGVWLFKSTISKPCAICGQNTTFIDYSFETHICSEECEDKIWKEYFEALDK